MFFQEAETERDKRLYSITCQKLLGSLESVQNKLIYETAF